MLLWNIWQIIATQRKSNVRIHSSRQFIVLYFTCLQIVVRTNIYSFLPPGTIQIFGHALNDLSVASEKLDCHAITTVITYRETGARLHHINTKLRRYVHVLCGGAACCHTTA
jgi:hypothetical protein